METEVFSDSFPLDLQETKWPVKKLQHPRMQNNKVTVFHRVPERPHAAKDHDGADDPDALVLWHGAGQLLADHDVEVILGGQQVVGP